MLIIIVVDVKNSPKTKKYARHLPEYGVVVYFLVLSPPLIFPLRFLRTFGDLMR